MKNKLLIFFWTSSLNYRLNIVGSTRPSNLTIDEQNALIFCLAPGQQFSDSPAKYMQIVKNKGSALLKLRQLSYGDNRQKIERHLFQIAFAHFIQTCSKKNLKLIGTEPEHYQPEVLSVEERDATMPYVLEENKSNVRNGLYIVGAGHGIALMDVLCGSGRGGFSFARLTVDEATFGPKAPFSQWHEKNKSESSGYSVKPGYGNAFEVKTINIKNSQNQQDQEFRALFKPYKGLVPIDRSGS